MSKLWAKEKHNTMTEALERFETQDDLKYDNDLTEFDIFGSIAHARMLGKIDVLKANEVKELTKALSKILEKYRAGNFVLESGDEDIHTKIENELGNLVGEISKKIHTGRSRNDQILTDVRLYSKYNILEISSSLIELIEITCNLAKKWSDIPMPGYTHMQKAMPSSVGLWLIAFAESQTDNIALLKTALEAVDQSPLGSAAAYGTTLPLDRKMTADLMDFSKVQNNSLYCQNSRGKIEAIVVFALQNIVNDISRIASDLLLFTTSEFDYFDVDKSICTGSSIMPQKKNLDIAELLRSKSHIMLGYFVQIQSIPFGLISGYNRDTQDTKKPYIEAIKLTKDSIEVAKLLLQNINPKTEKLKLAMSKELYATSMAYNLVASGMPFRTAYQKVGNDLGNITSFDPDSELKKSKHLGGTANLGIAKIQQKILKEKRTIGKLRNQFTEKLNNLLNI
ncbi:MAG: argininosuccinate lyase [Patescibacteria group bacterium]